MPVSVAVCETANVVNAALRESLGVNRSADNANKTGGSSNNNNGGDSADDLQSQIAANAKRVLLAKIEYEEVDNYNETVLEQLKSKYILIKPDSATPALNANKNGGSKIMGTNGHDNIQQLNGNRKQCGNASSEQQQSSPNELPKPKRVLYPREHIRIGWKQSDRKWQVGTGLINVGNTCYLNSTLQALFHIPALANWLVSETQHLENCNIMESGGCCTICALAKTLVATQTNTSAVRPFLVYSKLKQICKHMVVGRQEDAHEFLRFLVEAMEKAYLTRYRNYKELDQLVKETTPLNQIFGGYLRSAVRCLSCSHVSITFQHFQDMLLDIRKAETLEDAFDGYFARERLEDMGYKCEGCKKKVSATKQFSLERAPITLCIQLKRFSMTGNKLTKQITFKPRIDLSKYAARSPTALAQPLTYRLVSMVTHLGVSQNCGHYTAIGLTESGGYFNFDDSYVRPIAMQSVCNTNAYIMFYELDTAVSPARNLPQSTLAAANSSKINGLRLTNGVAATATSVSAPASPTRFIGPQLPPGGLNGHGPASNTNGHQKIAIHFKSSSSLVKQSPQKQQQQNGLLLGTGKFQESSHAKSSLVGASHKGETVAIANGNKSSSSFNASKPNVYLPMSSDEDDDDQGNDDNSGKAKSKINASSKLPSMPQLFAATPSSSMSKAAPLKSLVPYESASEEEEPVVISGASVGVQRYESNPRKRRSGASSDNDSESDSASQFARNGSANGHKLNGNGQLNGNNKAKSAYSSSTTSSSNANVNSCKQKTDVIDEIFKSLNNFNKNKHKPPSASTVSKVNQSDEDNDDDDEDDKYAANNELTVKPATATNGWRPQKMLQQQSQNGRAPPSPKTPPSPAVIKSKTGLWQITRDDEDDDNDDDVNAECSVQVKNHKNPFANRVAATETNAPKRQKIVNGNAKTQQRLGYQSEVNSNGSSSTVAELLKQTHRGYGASVLAWNGKQAELDKELLAETREQRQRDHDDDEENEMDRGRQRKLKSAAAPSKASGTLGYNPFQEYDNQKRWHKTSTGGSFPRFHHHNFRQNFHQRRFSRFGGPGSNKFQQQRALQRHLAAGGGFTRRNNQQLNSN